MRGPALVECDCGYLTRRATVYDGVMLRYCPVCDSLTPHKEQEHDTTPSDIQRHQLRLHNPTICVTDHGRSTGMIHLKDGDEKVCPRPAKFSVKDISVYPPGYMDWCWFCLLKKGGWPKQPTEDAVEAVLRFAHENTDSHESRKEFLEQRNVFPTPQRIHKEYGTWSHAMATFGFDSQYIREQLGRI